MPKTKLPYPTKRSFKNPSIEVSKEPSKTIPGETMSIQELLVRYDQGMQENRRQLQYFDEEDLSKINRFHSGSLDLTDLDDLNNHVASLQSAVTKAMEKRELDKKLREKEEAEKLAKPPATEEPES